MSRRDLIRQGSVLALIAMPAAACAEAEVTVELFTDIADYDVPDGTRVIRTRGWRKSGVGGARYVFDPIVDRAWVSRFPRSAAVTVNGRGFRLDELGGDVRRYGALGDGRVDDTEAINEALVRGGTVTLAGPATYIVTDRLLMPVARTRLRFDPSVTLQTHAWRWRGSQTPFGNAIHVTGDDCEVLGSGPTSILENVGSDANGIGFLHCGGGRVSRLVIKGGKDRLTAIVDDTFQSGISIVNDRANNPGGRPSRVVIENCAVTDWMQYGINVYGDLASDVVIRRTTITRSGKAGERLSVGAGIALTRGVGPVLLDANTIENNKGFGIFVSSAGAEIHDVTVSGNGIAGNGLDGIRCSEERHFGSLGDIGQRNVTITNNRIEHNGGAGVRIGTYDGVGSIRQATVLENRIRDNRGSGLLLQANAGPGRDVTVVVAKNEFIANDDYGIALGLNRINISYHGNVFQKNRGGDTVDYRKGTPRPLAQR